MGVSPPPPHKDYFSAHWLYMPPCKFIVKIHRYLYDDFGEEIGHSDGDLGVLGPLGVVEVDR